MNKKFLIRLSAILIISVFITGCRGHIEPTPPPVVPTQPVVIEYSVNIPGENLTALSKVTDSEYKCSHPYGGDYNKNLFFTVSTFGTKSYSNIFKKDNVLSASMSQKTSGNNFNTHAAYCAATDMLAFSGQFEGSKHWDVYMVNSSRGNALTQVTSNPDTEECYPDFSRDGKMIVYQKGFISSPEIWIKKLNTNENVMIGTGKRPSFSPDGRKIVYVRSSADGTVKNLWMMNNDGSSQVQLTNANLGSVDRPRFSPDGRYIVFQSYKKEKGDNDLYVIDTDGNNLSQLTINKSYDGDPYWSSDGYIYFTSDRGGKDGHYQIWRFRYGSFAQGVRTKSSTSSSYDTGTLPPPQPSRFTYHTVKDGETITDIAKRYGVTVKDIVKWNNLVTMTITPGMELKVSAQ